MSFRHPHHRRSQETGSESGDDLGRPADQTSRRRRRRDVESAYLDGAVEIGRLHCVRQEICTTANGEVVGLDVVARAPVAGRVATSRHMLASIETDAAAVEANALLLDEAIAMFNDHVDRFSPEVGGFVAVALDNRFIADESFLSAVKEATRRGGLEAFQLLLSVEADLALASLWPNLQRLKSHGVRIALEGFRLGPPANDLVSRFSFDVLRVDIGGLSFPEGTDPGSELGSIIRLARDLRCEVMAEHFSSKEQVALAIEADSDLIVLPAPDGVG